MCKCDGYDEVRYDLVRIALQDGRIERRIRADGTEAWVGIAKMAKQQNYRPADLAMAVRFLTKD
jgi:hypothetical protein